MTISKERLMTVVEDLEDKRVLIKDRVFEDVPAGHVADAVYGYAIDLLKGLMQHDEISSK